MELPPSWLQCDNWAECGFVPENLSHHLDINGLSLGPGTKCISVYFLVALTLSVSLIRVWPRNILYVPVAQLWSSWWGLLVGRRPGPGAQECYWVPRPLVQSNDCLALSVTPPQNTVGSLGWWCGIFFSFQAPQGNQVLWRSEIFNINTLSAVNCVKFWEWSFRCKIISVFPRFITSFTLSFPLLSLQCNLKGNSVLLQYFTVACVMASCDHIVA